MTLPNMDADVYFGDTEVPLPDWREVLLEDDTDDDALTAEERQELTALLGFDPRNIFN